MIHYAQLGDDDGSRIPEPGDDDGRRIPEPGDDDSSRIPEPGDDDGRRIHEPGDDDNGRRIPEPGDDEHDEADDEVGGDDVEPDLDGERVEEREETRALPLWTLEENADAQIHERLGEVDGLFTDPADCQ